MKLTKKKLVQIIKEEIGKVPVDGYNEDGTWWMSGKIEDLLNSILAISHPKGREIYEESLNALVEALKEAGHVRKDYVPKKKKLT